MNRVTFFVTPYHGPETEYIVRADVEGESGLVAVFATERAADTFAAAMNNAMDVADGHPRSSR